MDDIGPKVGVYIRTSTLDQNSDLQKDEILQYCKQRGWNSLAVFEDKASGTTTNRIAFKELLNKARARQVDLIVFWKLDRFARSLKHLLQTLDELNQLGVEFISIKDQFDCTTSSGKLMLQLLGAFSEFEAALLRERVRSGLSAARRRGKRLGRPPEINPEQVIALRKDGLSLSQIAKRLGISKSAVHKTLKKAAL